MGTTRYTEELLRACAASGIRARTGAAIMDSGKEVPPELRRDAAEALEETRELLRSYPSGDGERVGLCLAPRFIPTVSEPAWRGIVSLAREHHLLIHTHACETRDEIDSTRALVGEAPIPYLDRLGALSPRLCAAHGVWLTAEDRDLLRRRGAAIVHCPGSNAKLGSGTADLLALWRAGVRVGIGCDGAACNNRLDPWEEMRRAAHAVASLHGPEVVEPARILEMATREGAEILGLGARIGSLEPGKEADLVVLNPERAAGLWASGDDLHAQVLYGAGREHVEQVWIQGRKIVEGERVRGLPHRRVLQEATRAARALRARVEEPCGSPSS
jgi:cytosine/adenosine deaminase-related metal-dependent hydrolase